MLKHFISIVSFSLILLRIESASIKRDQRVTFDASVCNSLPQFTDQIRAQIRNSSKDVQRIIDYVVNGPDRGVTYNELSIFVDKFGSRFAGFQTFEDSIDYMLNLLKKDGHENVHTESAPIIPWV